MTLLRVAAVCFLLCATAIVGEPSSDVTGTPVMAVREKRYTIPYKCPRGMVKTLWGCVPAGRSFKRPDSSIFDMPYMNSPRITRTRGIFRRRVRPFESIRA